MPENQTINDNKNNLTESGNSNQKIDKKSLAYRRQLMAQQAEAMEEHYQQDKSWQDWVNLDLGQLYEY